MHFVFNPIEICYKIRYIIISWHNLTIISPCMVWYGMRSDIVKATFKLHMLVYVSVCFFVSRAVVVCGMFFGNKFVLPHKNYDAPLLSNHWWEMLLRWDANHYLHIADKGYHDTYIAWFPLYPLMIRMLSAITTISSVLVGLFLSNMFFFLSLLLIAYYVKKYYVNADFRIAVGLLAFHPSSFYFVTTYTESLFLFLAVLAFVLIAEQKYFSSAFAISLLGATRMTGLFVLTSCVPVYVAFLMKSAMDKEKIVYTKNLLIFIVWSLLSLAGFICFAAYLQIYFGHWDAFIRIKKLWGYQMGNPLNIIKMYNFSMFYHMNLLPALVTIMFSCLFLFKKAYRHHCLWGLLIVLTVFWTGTIDGLLRYTMVYFPMMIYTSEYLKKYESLKDFTMIALGIGLFFMTALFVQGYNIG
ncbi:Mannosyltransferase, PIG-V [Candidatus Magnetobacterium bavaricum]|uniref:Mannosyltransferase, PIG-V n=1 Tax=Candidatus Magnetobacterium bavaricum TaxID=29290 RepID=A0A0F3GZX0_9BACT|nr:Mannosyltransferase, PIG-V [Candidatus Magnetobacterium bavaricum]